MRSVFVISIVALLLWLWRFFVLDALLIRAIPTFIFFAVPHLMGATIAILFFRHD
jgi:hypothetical protein